MDDTMLQIDPRGVLDTAIDAARLSSPVIDSGDQKFAYVPANYALKDISDPLRLPARVRQVVTLDDRASMIAFLNRFQSEDAVLIADFDSLTIRGVVDFHTTTLQPGACEFRAELKLLMSEEFQRWNALEGQLHDQAVFAEFLEENAVNIHTPDPATMVEISRELEATIGAKFKSKIAPESGDRAFVYETETHTKGDVVVPKEFALEIPLYNGEDPVIVRARFRFRPTPEGLKLGFVWHRVEYQRRAIFNEIAYVIAEGTGRPVFAGRAGQPMGLALR